MIGRHPSQRRVWTVGVFVLLTGVAYPATAQHARAADTAPGTVVRVRTMRIGDGVRPRSRAGEGLLIRTRGERQRVDVLTSIDDTSGGDWITTGATPREMRVHTAAQRKTLVMKFSDMQLMFGSLMRTRIDSATAEAELLGPGPRVLGEPTERVTIRRRFRMLTSRNGKTQTVRVMSEIRALIAPGVPESVGANSALSLTSGSTADLVEQIFGDGASQVRVRDGRPLPRGLALRSVSRSQIVASGAVLMPFGVAGDTAVSVDSVEVLSIVRQPLEDALFAEPTGYEVVDFGEQLRAVVTMMDSLSASLESLSKGSKSSKPPVRPKPTTKPYKP
jgi:hypothetical protein